IEELEIITISETQTRLNALLAGQVHAINGVDPPQARVLESREGIKLLEAPSGAWTPLVMATKRPPFDDLQVRQAFRLIVDRNQIIENVLSGHGQLGNDLFSPFDPMYTGDDLPQQEQDLEKARFLLKSAGQENLTVALHTADFAPGALNSAIVFAEQAKQAGVTVNLDRGPAGSYYDEPYLKTPFFQTNWGYRALDPQILQCVFSKSPWNETQWARPEFDQMTAEARATLDEAKRRELYLEAQKMLWEEGGYILWGFLNYLDAHREEVQGFKAHVGRNLMWYGFQDVWLS
ncbi:MAG: ABC transporter substrate-binding protein, partial [Vicinamibacteria bacterium]